MFSNNSNLRSDSSIKVHCFFTLGVGEECGRSCDERNSKRNNHMSWSIISQLRPYRTVLSAFCDQIRLHTTFTKATPLKSILVLFNSHFKNGKKQMAQSFKFTESTMHHLDIHKKIAKITFLTKSGHAVSTY